PNFDTSLSSWSKSPLGRTVPEQIGCNGVYLLRVAGDGHVSCDDTAWQLTPSLVESSLQSCVVEQSPQGK
nr:hypothetical protein [Tanacetum cinerariifolium]